MSIAGHASRAMLSCYSRVRMEPKGRALTEIAAPARGRRQSPQKDGNKQRAIAESVCH